MNIRLMLVVALMVAICSVRQVSSLDFLKQIQQGVGAATETAVATKETVDAFVQLVSEVDRAVANIGQKVIQLTKTAENIITNDAQKSIKSSFGTSIDVSMDLLPALQQLTQAVSLVGSRILPTLAKFPGMPSEVSRDVASVSATIATIVMQVDGIKATLDQWLPKIKNLSSNIGEHAIAITQQVEGTIADIEKIGF